MLKNIKHLIELSNKYNIPTEDLLLLDLNLSGVRLNLQSRRVRFELESTNKDIFSLSHSRNISNFYLAIPTVDRSYYSFKNGNLFFNSDIIGKAWGVTEDFCDSSYPRRGGTVLNINPNARTSCRGCKFCYTFFQVPRDKECILSDDKLRSFLENWMKKFDVTDLSHLMQIAIVTGCFPNEQKVVDFLKIAKNILNEFLFKGELFYFGSQIKSEKALLELKKIRPLGICFSLECFDNKNREHLLRDVKRDLSLNAIKEALIFANNLDIRTNFSYIIGLESLETIEKGFYEFLPYINSFPIINAFQAHKGQKTLRHNDANKIDYYIKTRKIIENIFAQTTLRPRPWENYRSLWYLKFGEEFLDDIRTPLSSPKHKMFDEIVAGVN
ncbi:MAG: hypothetical protein C0412_20140 [Flavobacterium sp.]|nr:hypothetical protein [Flavobacterium sp.]